ncbi:hypothetical protein KIPB_003399 [Kipferlia bialata]|uniref:Uncharacterized protein n=1 Tax=Kipferlia bialata TaxID=797122 RepID=A0A9K3GH75_9EUKA|nr:hypothetical protein KIPB_003399 [Kipferlia bialata]|eukprot:g3399.t1
MSRFLGTVLHLCLGFGPFTLINALWSEAPFFIKTLPEGDAISSHITVCYNLANILPFLMVVMRGRKTGGMRDGTVLLLLFSIGCLVCVGLATAWDVTVDDVSVMVLLASFMAGIVGCTAIVFTFSYVANSDPYYTSITSTGLTVSGMVTALLGNVQIGLEDPQVSLFWWLVLPMQAVSVIAVVVLNTEASQKAYKAGADRSSPSYEETEGLLLGGSGSGGMEPWAGSQTQNRIPPPPLSAYVTPCVHMLWTSLLIYTLTPSLLPYATDRYGDDQSQVMSVLNTVYTVFNFLGRLGSIIDKGSPLVLNIFQTGLLTYFAYFAVSDVYIIPMGLYVEVAWQAFVAGYVATIVYTLLTRPAYRRRHSLLSGQIGVDQDKTIKRWIGLSNQAGSLLASGIGLLFSHYLGA